MDILHRVAATAAPDDVYTALTTRDGLAGWWAVDTSGTGALGDVLEFRFELGDISMRVDELVPGTRVRWEVVAGPDEWIGTHVSFDLTQDGEWTVVLFAHTGWVAPVEFMHHCSTKWALFLMSLKELVESGKGSPEPHDVKLGNWG